MMDIEVINEQIAKMVFADESSPLARVDWEWFSGDVGENDPPIQWRRNAAAFDDDAAFLVNASDYVKCALEKFVKDAENESGVSGEGEVKVWILHSLRGEKGNILESAVGEWRRLENGQLRVVLCAGLMRAHSF